MGGVNFNLFITLVFIHLKHLFEIHSNICLFSTNTKIARGTNSTLTARHWRRTHVCFSLPGPPNFFISRQKLHSPHSGRRHASQRLHRTRRRRSTDIEEAGFVGRGMIGVVANLGRPTGAGGGGGWYQDGWMKQSSYIKKVNTNYVIKH